jgi:hypothetical protein
MDRKSQKPQQIQIQVKEEVADGKYANLAIITHSAAEFVMDFVRVMPGTPKANVQSRMIMTPSHAKAFLRALEQNISKYESEHGEIKMPEPMNLPGMPIRSENMPN